MRILVAEDDPVSRRVLETTLQKWGYDVVSVSDGQQAWAVLSSETAPPLAILDWMMPEVDGVELCRRVRGSLQRPIYIILLTARGSKEDIVAGLQSGADDYVTKPFDREELRARVQAGVRIVTLQME
ncbi:MAG TPA: response regulator transcription factor, partial [Blastocatellia bacterium]|nr:response regulator transcription factor [Blastocatellia bacterium]